MSAHAPYRMSVAEFLEWEFGQEDRHEFVDGVPRAMTGARMGHDLVVGNVRSALSRRLRTNGNPCEAFGADIALIVPMGNVRRLDVAVYFPPFDSSVMARENPRVVVEVLTTSTQEMDQLFKLEEYQAIAGLGAIIFIAPTIRLVGVWSRDPAAAWRRVKLRDADASIELPALGVSLPLSEVYERVVFEEVRGPRLVWPDPA